MNKEKEQDFLEKLKEKLPEDGEFGDIDLNDVELMNLIKRYTQPNLIEHKKKKRKEVAKRRTRNKIAKKSRKKNR